MQAKSTVTRVYRSSLFKDSFWAIFGNAIGKALSLAVGIFIANILGSNDYGQYGMIKSTLIYMSIFSTFGLGVTGTKYVAEYKENKPQSLNVICTNILIITLSTGLLMALALLVFADGIAVYLEAPETKGILRLSAIAIIFNSINSSQTGIMSGFKAFKQISINSIWTGVFTCFVGTGLTYFYKLEGAIVALTLAYVFNCILNYIDLRKLRNFYPKSDGYDKSIAKEMLSFSLPIALQEGLRSVSQWASIAVLVKLASYSELGIFNATGQWTAIISFLPSVLKNVTLSYLSDDSKNHDRIVNIMVLVNTVVSIFIIVIVFLASGLITDLYGSSFIGLGPVLSLMVFSTAIGSIGSVYVQELISNSHNWLSFIVTFAKSCLIIVLGTVLILMFKMSGAISFAYATLLSNVLFLSTLVILYYTSRK